MSTSDVSEANDTLDNTPEDTFDTTETKEEDIAEIVLNNFCKMSGMEKNFQVEKNPLIIIKLNSI